MEEQSREKRMMIEGDFNARTGEEGGWIYGEEEEERKKKLEDKKINGRKIVDTIGEVR